MASRLPNEVLRQVVVEYDILRRYGGCQASMNLTSIAMVNYQWLAVVETFIWNRIRIETSEIDLFRSMLSRSSRRRWLCQLSIESGDWFKTKDCHDEDGSDDSDEGFSYRQTYILRDGWRQWDDGVIAQEHGDLEERASFLQQEFRRFFQILGRLWNEMASWDQDLSLKKLNLDIRGSSVFSHLGRGFRAASAVQEHLMYKDWLNMLPSLSPLPSVLYFNLTSGIDGFSIAVAGCRLCKTLPNVEKFRLVTPDHEKTWYYARKHMREGYSSSSNMRNNELTTL